MTVEITLNTPLADALNTAIQSKIVELGWVGGGTAEDAALAEFFMLMLVNGKTQEEVAAEISGDLLGLGPEDQTVPAFCAWLFEQIDSLNAQLNPVSAPTTRYQNATQQPQDDMMDSAFGAEMDMMADGPAEISAPTGPKAMRNGNPRGGREKRIVGHMNRAMDRSHDSVLHRVRGQSGNERISRTPPSGPRMGVGRQPRMSNGRAANLAAGMANMVAGNPSVMGGMNPMNAMNGMPGMNNFMMAGQPDLLAMMEQQGRVLQQLQQQLSMQQGGAQNNGGHGHGKSLFERASRGHGNQRRGGHHQHNGHQSQPAGESAAEGVQVDGDVEMGQSKREAPNPEEMVCKYNLRCTNPDCKFAHQSPAAPPGVTVDVKDVCSFGAACKNRKCVGRHPSPATRAVHQSEMDCKFFPNCTNPRCPFRHPDMPPCRNGGECKVPNCKFTHVKTVCKFNPCTNRFCPFTHEEGQRGTFQDKVWVSDENKTHVSERRFVDENAVEDLVLPGSGSDEMNAEASGVQEVIG